MLLTDSRSDPLLARRIDKIGHRSSCCRTMRLATGSLMLEDLRSGPWRRGLQETSATGQHANLNREAKAIMIDDVQLRCVCAHCVTCMPHSSADFYCAISPAVRSECSGGIIHCILRQPHRMLGSLLWQSRRSGRSTLLC